MCGRYTITVKPDAVRQEMGVVLPQDYQPRYNVAPTQPVAVVTDSGSREAVWMRWGLIPSWAKDPAIGNKLINARSETLIEKPSFRSAFAKRRCLIVADGFYEWQKGGAAGGRSQPFFFQREDEKPFAFAGLWEFWRTPEGEPLHTCTIITCAANELVAPVHQRMPVMLSGDALWDWLMVNDTAALQTMLKPYPAEMMKRVPVAPLVNSPEVDQPELVLPL